MKRFIEGEDRTQVTLLPECLDDYVAEDNPVRVVEVFVDQLDLRGLGFAGAAPAPTGRPSYHPSVLLKLYIYGYLNRIQSSRRLERETQRNLELIWLAGRLTPDFKTIADFRKDNGAAIRRVCREFIVLCRQFAQTLAGRGDEIVIAGRDKPNACRTSFPIGKHYENRIHRIRTDGTGDGAPGPGRWTRASGVQPHAGEGGGPEGSRGEGGRFDCR